MHLPRETRVKTWSETFINAVSHRDLGKAQELLLNSHGQRPEGELRPSLRKALQIASAHGDVALVSFLLGEGASTVAVEKETPALIRAVEAESHAVVKLLLSDPSNRTLRRAIPLSSIPPEDVYVPYRSTSATLH